MTRPAQEHVSGGYVTCDMTGTRDRPMWSFWLTNPRGCIRLADYRDVVEAVDYACNVLECGYELHGDMPAIQSWRHRQAVPA